MYFSEKTQRTKLNAFREELEQKQTEMNGLAQIEFTFGSGMKLRDEIEQLKGKIELLEELLQ